MKVFSHLIIFWSVTLWIPEGLTADQQELPVPPRSIDLGEISISGEVRRPAIRWIDSKKPVRDLLLEYFLEELESFEKELCDATR